ACVQACMECGTHRGQSLIHLEKLDRATSTQTAPMVCMHCEDPTCAQVCPADAIKQTEDGIVQSALKPRCIGCSNCVIACPFGVPKYIADFDQMMKCDMCTDRTSEGLKPMCASVCPSEALWYGTIEQFNDTRRGSLLRDFMFGRQEVRTKVYTVVDDLAGGPIDVVGGTATSWLDDPFGLEEGGGGTVPS
ncbi:4Fe-4S dicluster domain-containing protein, partial [Ilumatobacter sp.]|uniref:4Fe-4S dicluster domain-containing protein n=1 Tax=Ilumatobacter sp. TaxID=1967498 RepID=UPI003C4226CC